MLSNKEVYSEICIRLKSFGDKSDQLLDNHSELNLNEFSDYKMISSLSAEAGLLAVGTANLLTISPSQSVSDIAVVEMEFENLIQAVCWDDDGACILVGDAAGYLHFVTCEGSLIFSQRILPSKLLY
jgi:hypothetical protein